MDAQQIAPLVLKELGIRIGPAMAHYVARQMTAHAAAPAATIAVIGGDARTGVPVRKWLNATAIQPQPPRQT